MGAGIATLPRELAPGVFWLGDCYKTRIGDVWTHSYQAPYFVAGSERSLLVDTGPAKDWRAIERQLDELLDEGLASVAYIFPTHPETAHAANLGRLLLKFPDAIVCSIVQDYHLIFPDFEDRLVGTEVGEELDLGDRRLVVIEAVFRDLPSQWLYDPQARVLFTGDGFAYKHHHGVGECGRCAEEIPDLPIPELTAVYADAAFYWTRFCDIEPVIAQLEALFESHEIDVVAPGHGCPIRDPKTTVPKVVEGLRMGQTSDREELGRRLAEYLAARQGGE